MNDELLEKSGPETFGSSERCLHGAEHAHMVVHQTVRWFDSTVVREMNVEVLMEQDLAPLSIIFVPDPPIKVPNKEVTAPPRYPHLSPP